MHTKSVLCDLKYGHIINSEASEVMWVALTEYIVGTIRQGPLPASYKALFHGGKSLQAVYFRCIIIRVYSIGNAPVWDLCDF